MKLSFFFLLLLTTVAAPAQVVNLNGSWKFHIGDNEAWSAADFNDANWETIRAPSPWEDEGFNNYDGFAWYRKTFDGRKLDRNENYYLGLGYIDDCDEVYVNGKLVGFSGFMPPKFKTSYNTERTYPLLTDLIKFNGENTIAIRVYDVTQGGGIVDGDLGIFRMRGNKNLLIDLQGIWQFAPTKGEEKIWNQSSWVKIMVPGPWEHQGFSRYDGTAWYKRTFSVPSNFTSEPLVLLLGRIDDFDKVFINDQLIGKTNDHRPYGRSGSYEQFRAYEIPSGVLRKNGNNTIEVLVEDMGNIGGIYEGPVGITTRSIYERNFHN